MKDNKDQETFPIFFIIFMLAIIANWDSIRAWTFWEILGSLWEESITGIKLIPYTYVNQFIFFIFIFLTENYTIKSLIKNHSNYQFTSSYLHPGHIFQIPNKYQLFVFIYEKTLLQRGLFGLITGVIIGILSPIYLESNLFFQFLFQYVGAVIFFIYGIAGCLAYWFGQLGLAVGMLGFTFALDYFSSTYLQYWGTYNIFIRILYHL